MGRLEKLFLISFSIGGMLKLNLVPNVLDSFFVILNFEVESYNLELELLILAMVLFDKVFSSSEGILLEVAFRFEVLHVLSLLNRCSDWRLNQLLFNRLQRSYVHHLSVGCFLRKFCLLKFIFIRCRNFTNKNNTILYSLYLVVCLLYA
jgi:hypothetical protein